MDDEAAGPLLERFREIRDQILEELKAGNADVRADLEDTRQRLLVELEASRAEQRGATSAQETAIANDRAVTREMLLDMREGREQLVDIRHGIQANTEGLLRVLDELRRGDGPSPAGA